MKRVDRVMDLLELLRASETTTVATLAGRLGVSRRTVLRDLATLRDRGQPIRSEGGPGGGVFLQRDRGVTAVHLAVEEVVALWMAAQLSLVGSVLPWNRSARSALNKVFASLPRDRARPLRSLVKRIVVGRPASPRVLEELLPPSPEVLTVFERAFSQHVCMAFDYVDRHQRRSARRVEPHGLLLEAPAWYVLARDTQSGEARTFRMDRIRNARALPGMPFEPDVDALHRDHTRQREVERRRPA